MQKNQYEQDAWKQSKYVCGIDEVGRGCLSGPLVVSAAILPINAHHPRLKDSKKLSAQDRETVYTWLIQQSTHSTVIVSPRMIDHYNIYQATLFAMKKAFLQITTHFPCSNEELSYLLVDAMPLANTFIHQCPNLGLHSFNYGETYSTSIAAASIIAKVTRDRLMTRLSPSFPRFGLEQHKGYGTRKHLAQLSQAGYTIIHRTTFTNNLKKERSDNAHQQTLFTHTTTNPAIR